MEAGSGVCLRVCVWGGERGGIHARARAWWGGLWGRWCWRWAGVGSDQAGSARVVPGWLDGWGAVGGVRLCWVEERGRLFWRIYCGFIVALLFL